MTTRTHGTRQIYGSDYDTEPLTIQVVLTAKHGFLNGYFYAPLGCREWDESDWIDFLNTELPDDFDPNTINREMVMNSEHLWYEIYVDVPEMERVIASDTRPSLASGQLR